jgi:hypothetical protein
MKEPQQQQQGLPNEQPLQTKPDGEESDRLKTILEDLDLIKPKSARWKVRVAVVSILTAIMLAISMAVVGTLQYQMILVYEANTTTLIDSNTNICFWIDLHGFNIIATPMAVVLVLFYMFMFWRRSCCLTCLFRRPAPPMIIAPFKKDDRFMSACVYGIMAHQVMNIVMEAIFKSGLTEWLSQEVPSDPTGLFKLTIRIVQVLIVALRYWPPLIAFYANSFVIYLTSAVYMIIDLGNNIYVEGRFIEYFIEYHLKNRSKKKTSKLISTPFFFPFFPKLFIHFFSFAFAELIFFLFILTNYI